MLFVQLEIGIKVINVERTTFSKLTPSCFLLYSPFSFFLNTSHSVINGILP